MPATARGRALLLDAQIALARRAAVGAGERGAQGERGRAADLGRAARPTTRSPGARSARSGAGSALPLRSLRAEAEARYALGDLLGAVDRLRAGQRLARGGGPVDFIDALGDRFAPARDRGAAQADPPPTSKRATADRAQRGSAAAASRRTSHNPPTRFARRAQATLRLARTGSEGVMRACIGALAGVALRARRERPRAPSRSSPRRRRARSRRCARSSVKFSEAVVAFGDPRLADPLTIACQGDVPAGSGRWSERSRLAVRLPRAARPRHALHGDGAQRLEAGDQAGRRAPARPARARRSPERRASRFRPAARRSSAIAARRRRRRSRRTSTSCCA